METPILRDETDLFYSFRSVLEKWFKSREIENLFPGLTPL